MAGPRRVELDGLEALHIRVAAGAERSREGRATRKALTAKAWRDSPARDAAWERQRLLDEVRRAAEEERRASLAAERERRARARTA